MKSINSSLVLILTSLLYFSLAQAQDNLWSPVDTAAKASGSISQASHFDSNDQALRSKLNLVPSELRGQTEIISLPMPDGTLAQFSIVESSIMGDKLAAKYPDIKSYKVYGIDDPSAFGRVDISQKGFRGMLMTSTGRIFIDPEASSSTIYVSRLRNGYKPHTETAQPFQCSVYDLPGNQSELLKFNANKIANRIPGSLLRYRLAVSATQEYVAAVGGGGSNTDKINATIAEINTAITRVNVFYERDLGVQLMLVGGGTLIDVDGTASINVNGVVRTGFSNSDDLALLEENQVWIDAQLGSANYDIGHIFGTGGGGIASLQSVCSSGRKAQGVTGLPNPTGDDFYIDFVAHEIGHQFGGNHSYNGTEGSCGTQRNQATAFEPGSGTSIMGYAGICGSENVQSKSDATFHAGTIAEMNAFIAGAGSACSTPVVIAPANADPAAVNAGADSTIPKGTAFRLEGGVATDANGDTIIYQWDQMDVGAPTSGSTIGNDLTTNTLYRTFAPDEASRIRDFPAMSTQRSGIEKRGEALTACEGRTLNFRLTARDGKSGQGTDDVKVTVASSGPFVMTSHTTASTFAAKTTQTVNWNVAGTTAAPVSCANVNIDLLNFSLDGSTYGVTPVDGPVINSGSRVVTIPDMSGTRARFRVSCSDNVFYDISNADLIITGGLAVLPSVGNSSNIFAQTAITSNVAQSFSCNAVDTILSPNGGGGSFDNLLLTFLLSLLLMTSVPVVVARL